MAAASKARFSSGETLAMTMVLRVIGICPNPLTSIQTITGRATNTAIFSICYVLSAFVRGLPLLSVIGTICLDRGAGQCSNSVAEGSSFAGRQIVSFSDYIVYVDESGDHNLATINPQSPVFVLAFCIFDKEAYRAEAVPAVQALKFEFWGHDCAILHSHEIRKARGDFNILLNPHTRARFIDRMNDVMAALPMTVIAAVIDKPRHVRRYREPNNPYEIALAFCMERLQRWLVEQRQDDRLSHVIVERRGKPEDEALELEFRRIAAGRNLTGKMPNLDIRFMDKKHNSTGLQIADLVAHPIGRHVIDPKQPNRAFDLIEPKLRRSSAGFVRGYGLKVFP